MEKEKRILAAVASDDVFGRFEPLVSRSDLSVTRARSGYHGMTLAHDASYQLVISQHPFTDLSFGEFHSTLRATDSASRQAPLLVLTRDDRLDALSESLDDEDAQLFCIDLAPEQVDKALGEILGLAVRATSRLLVQARLDCAIPPVNRVFQTVDISESGLLFRAGSSLPLGSSIRFALELPESAGPVRGKAEVVRRTRPEVEKVEGTAIRFVELDREGRAELASYIQGQTARAPGPRRPTPGKPRDLD